MYRHDHSAPVNHTWMHVQMQEWPDECVWSQLHGSASNTTWPAGADGRWAPTKNIAV
jgi:hypothetical protein